MIQSNIYLSADNTPAICLNSEEVYALISSIIDRREKLQRLVGSNNIPSDVHVRATFEKELDCLTKVENILWGLFPKINP